MHELVHIVQTFLQQIQPSNTTHTLNLNQTTNINSNTDPTPPTTHPPKTNLGLVLSDDDWDILLSTPSVITKIEENPNQTDRVINFDLTFGLQEPV